ncbi:MAG: hypothetical protein ACYCYP_03195 [Leptospirales bacterium]
MMAKPSTPTGRPRRIRIKISCHTGIEPLRQFWDLFSGMRRAHRQEYLRTCLFLGFRFGRPERSGWPEPDPNGKIRTIRIDFFCDHPCLGSFLKRYDRSEAWDKSTRWVLKTLVCGHEFLSGKDLEKIEREIVPPGAESREIPDPNQSPKDLLGELFS